MRKEFKAFDKVLVKHPGNSVWNIDFYSHYNKEDGAHESYSTVIRSEDRILPYEGNEHLVGTTDEPDEEVTLKIGEYCFFAGDVSDSPQDWRFSMFRLTNDEGFRVSYVSWPYAIRFSDFNPNDMEETRKHILCVKNGKIVKYKG